MGRWIIIILLLLPGVSLFGQDEIFEGIVDRTTAGIGERFQLSLVLRNAGMSGGKNLALPSLDNFYVLSGPNQSSSMQIINGSVSSSITYGYVLQPKEVGTFTIGAASIEAGGKTLTTKPIVMEIVKTAPPAGALPGVARNQDASEIADNLFLRAVVDRRKVTQGEQINLTYKLYTRVSIQNYSIEKNPILTGFWGEETENPKNVSLTTETINGKQYRVGVIRRMALFPTQPGTLEISPMEMKTLVQVQEKRYDPFDSFFRDPFGKTVTYAVKSEPVRIDVSPLPGGAPGGFKGAIGQFAMNVNVDKTRTKANEPVSLKITLSGTGNIKLLESPRVEIPVDFEQFSPKVNDNIGRKGDLVSGSKTFEYLLIPRYPGEKKIKPVSFSYFDLKKKRYETLSSKEIVLTIDPGTGLAGGSSLTGPAREGVQVLSQDIRFIRTGGSLTLRDERLYSLPVMVGLVLLPLVGFGGLIASLRQREAALKDQAGFRNKRAVRIAQRGLRHAKQMLDKPEMFIAFSSELARALWTYAGSKLNLQQAELSIDRVEEAFQRRGIEEGTTTAFRSLIESCEMARFAPAGTEKADMQKMFNEAGRIIVELEKRLRTR